MASNSVYVNVEGEWVKTSLTFKELADYRPGPGHYVSVIGVGFATVLAIEGDKCWVKSWTGSFHTVDYSSVQLALRVDGIVYSASMALVKFAREFKLGERVRIFEAERVILALYDDYAWVTSPYNREGTIVLIKEMEHVD